MFDTFFTNIKPKLYRNSTNDFAGYHSNGWNKQASNVAQSLISSLRSLKLGRFRYESVDTTDSEYNGSWIQMLPRVYDASPNDRGGCWSPVELSSSIKGDAEREATVVDRFLRIVQIDRSIPCVLDESQMERFYVIWNSFVLSYYFTKQMKSHFMIIVQHNMLVCLETKWPQGNPATVGTRFRIRSAC